MTLQSREKCVQVVDDGANLEDAVNLSKLAVRWGRTAQGKSVRQLYEFNEQSPTGERLDAIAVRVFRKTPHHFQPESVLVPLRAGFDVWNGQREIPALSNDARLCRGFVKRLS